MHHRRALSLCLGLELLVMLSACTDTTEPSRWLNVSLTASSAVVHADEPVTITVTAVNHGARPVEVIATGCPEVYRVSDASGAVVAPGPTVCALIASTRVLNSGERLDFSYSWAGTTRERINGPTVQLRAGTYQLRGVVATRAGEVTSEAVPIQVQP
jgi:hypothetical protein